MRQFSTCIVLAAAVCSISAGIVRADIYNWTAGLGSPDQNWGNPNNWAKASNSAHLVPGSADVAAIPVGTFANGVNLGANQSINGVTLGANAFFQTLDAFTLSIGAQGITGAVGSNLLLNGQVTLTAAQTWSLPPTPPANAGLIVVYSAVDTGGFPLNLSMAPTGTVLFGGNLIGNGGLTISGGTAGLSINTTFSGPTTISGGTLLLGAANALGNTSSIKFAAAGSVLQYSSASPSTTVWADVSARIVNSSSPMVIDVASTATVIYGSGLAASNTAGLVKQDTGTLILTGASAFTGGTTVSGGTLQIGNGGTTGSVPGDIVDNATVAFNRSGIVAVNGNITGAGLLAQNGTGTLVLAGSAPLTTSLAVNNGAVKFASPTATVAVLPSLAMANNGGAYGVRTYSGQIDVTDGSLVIRNGNLADVTDMARSGQNGPSPFTGKGITSSLAAADATGQLRYAVGVVKNNIAGSPLYDTFAGVTVGLNDVLVKFTYFGDADLNGIIDDTDFFLVNNGFGNQLTGWVNGDFDYSGTVDDTDFFLINNSYGLQGLRAGPAGSVPEPMGLGLIVGALGALSRRTRR